MDPGSNHRSVDWCKTNRTASACSVNWFVNLLCRSKNDFGFTQSTLMNHFHSVKLWINPVHWNEVVNEKQVKVQKYQFKYVVYANWIFYNWLDLLKVALTKNQYCYITKETKSETPQKLFTKTKFQMIFFRSTFISQLIICALSSYIYAPIGMNMEQTVSFKSVLNLKKSKGMNNLFGYRVAERGFPYMQENSPELAARSTNNWV